MSQHLIKYPFDPQANKQRLLEKYQSNNPEHAKNIAHVMLASHATSWKNLMSILQDGAIYSYHKVAKQHPKVVADSKLTTTDKLDIELGLDKFVFLSMGRGTLSELVTHYVCFRHDIINIKGSLASLLEIAEYGALVGPHAVAAHKTQYGLHNSHITQLNETAKTLFFSQVVEAQDFDHILSAFLKKHYQHISDYTLAQHFPETFLPNSFPFVTINKDRRQGPQLIIPHQLPLDHNLYGIIDVYGSGDLTHHIKPHHPITKKHIIKLKEVAQAVPGMSDLPHDIFKRNPHGKPLNLMLVVNMVIEELGNLALQGYDGNLQEGVTESLRQAYPV